MGKKRVVTIFFVLSIVSLLFYTYILDNSSENNNNNNNHNNNNNINNVNNNNNINNNDNNNPVDSKQNQETDIANNIAEDSFLKKLSKLADDFEQEQQKQEQERTDSNQNRNQKQFVDQYDKLKQAQFQSVITQVLPEGVDASPATYYALQVISPKGLHKDVDAPYFLQSFTEAVHCSTEERLGEVYDGGKWTCHPQIHLTKEKDCVIYSFGSNAIVQYELTLHSMAPNCDIHIFDPTPGIQSRIEALNLPEDIKFHYLGLTTDTSIPLVIADKVVPSKTLDEIARDLGHSKITILKIDIEQNEFKGSNPLVDTSENSIWRKVDQFQIEIHTLGYLNQTIDLHKRLYSVGLRLFHKELNFFDLNCWEFAYVNPQRMKQFSLEDYTPFQILSTKNKILETLTSARINAIANYENSPEWTISHVPFFYDLTHSYDMRCRNRMYIPGQNTFALCFDPFLIPTLGTSQDDNIIIYHLDDSETIDSPYSSEFVKKYPNFETHIWKTKVSDINTKTAHLHNLNQIELDEDKEIRKGTLETISNELGHTSIDVLHISVGSGIKSTRNILSEAIKLKRANSPLQIVVESSLCLYRNIKENRVKLLSDFLDDIETKGFVNFDRSINILKMKQTPENQRFTWESMCEYVLTFILY